MTFPEGDVCTRCALEQAKQIQSGDAKEESLRTIGQTDTDQLDAQEEPTFVGNAAVSNEEPTYASDRTERDHQQRTLPSGTLFQSSQSDRGFEHYDLVEELGRGGMGVVYRAIDKRLGREVAIKMLLAGDAASGAELERFEAEARAVASLEHEGILPIYEVGVNQGRPFFSMPLVVGGSLDDRLRDDSLTEEASVELLVQICEAIEHAHRKGIVHRDLKPGNILFDSNGRPRITDFGLAKRVDSQSQLTATGQTLGTPSFMAPEQAMGRSPAIDERTDVYAIGAILYVMLTGRPTFVGDSALAVMMSVLESEPELPSRFNSSVSRDLEAICLKCLEKKNEDRYGSVEALIEDLKRFLNGEPVSVNRLSSWGVIRRWYRITRRNNDVRIESKSRILGFPWVSIAFGRNEDRTEETGKARGVFAFGDQAVGFVAIGTKAYGFLAFGRQAVGVIAWGLFSAGLVGTGLISCGGIVFGGLAIGGFAMGAVAVGYAAFGLIAIGLIPYGAWARSLSAIVESTRLGFAFAQMLLFKR